MTWGLTNKCSSFIVHPETRTLEQFLLKPLVIRFKFNCCIFKEITQITHSMNKEAFFESCQLADSVDEHLLLLVKHINQTCSKTCSPRRFILPFPFLLLLKDISYSSG